ncbi:hypothetical protein EDM53_03925 [Rickettsiales endosymbiont of Peranema trichophorum]|uniref:hypothetical protein n=1 Tax=Rickettsiales endosymbiont of Peranema trichophorum TaxID=2486577 RepID=UPI001022DE74|nr:hypothetical protein [Rickettsiales endosymbiont of Peranema trichophorum]RZI46700.1 hypothetical protein EDM53_03925 [Rickettsiales endosymbiont of Peranema trichophorum]
MSNINSKIQKLQDKQKRILQKIEILKNKHALRAKKNEIKKLTIIGSFFLNKYTTENKLNELHHMLNKYITNKKDRKILNLDNPQ